METFERNNIIGKMGFWEWFFAGRPKPEVPTEEDCDASARPIGRLYFPGQTTEERIEAAKRDDSDYITHTVQNPLPGCTGQVITSTRELAELGEAEIERLYRANADNTQRADTGAREDA